MRIQIEYYLNGIKVIENVTVNDPCFSCAISKAIRQFVSKGCSILSIRCTEESHSNDSSYIYVPVEDDGA